MALTITNLSKTYPNGVRALKNLSLIAATDEELRALESEFHVVSSHLVGGQHEIRVFAAASPGQGFHAVPVELEDVYFLNLSRHANN
jgi:ABC-2 type transport system ATP-binding protein